MSGIAINANKKYIPNFAQRLMDKNCNCCFNCHSFKLFEGVIANNLEDYRNLKGKCFDLDAIKEKIIRRNPVVLKVFSQNFVNYPISRVNCKFFEGDCNGK